MSFEIFVSSAIEVLPQVRSVPWTPPPGGTWAELPESCSPIVRQGSRRAASNPLYHPRMVAADLLPQGLRPGELPLVPDPGQEIELDLRAVEVPLPAREPRLDGVLRLPRGAEGRPRPHVDEPVGRPRTGEVGAPDPDPPRRVDLPREGQGRGGSAQAPPPPA